MFITVLVMCSTTNASLKVWKLRSMLSMPVNPVAIHHDSWAVKKFFPMLFVEPVLSGWILETARPEELLNQP